MKNIYKEKNNISTCLETTEKDFLVLKTIERLINMLNI